MPERLTHAARAIAQTLHATPLRRAQLSFGAAWTGEWAVTVAVGILAFRDGGVAAVGVVGMVRMLPAALLAPVIAVVVDRHPRERVLAGVGIVRAVALGGAAVGVATLSSAWPAYLLVAVAMLAHTLYRPAHSALLPSICTTASELVGANVVRGVLDSMSALIGPLVAGVLVGPIGVEGVFAVSAGAAAWSAWLVWRVRYEAPPRIVEAVPGRAGGDAIEGLAIVARRPDVRLLTLLGCVQTFTRGCFAVFSVVVALQLLDTGESGVAVLTAGFGAGAMLGSFAVSLLIGGSSMGRLFAAGVAAWGLPFAALAATSSETVAVALLAVVGVANAVVDLAKFTLMQWLVPDELMGRVFTANESLVTLAAAAGSLATPGLIALFGIRGALLAIGLLAPLVVPFALRRLRSIDAQFHASGETVALLQRVSILRPLPLSTITRLASEASTESVTEGTVVIEEGTTGDDFYVVVDGWAEVLTDGASVRHLGPPECFGEVAALRGTRRTSTVRAHTALRLLRLTGPHFIRAVAGYTPSSAASSALIEERLAHAVSSRAGAPARGGQHR